MRMSRWMITVLLTLMLAGRVFAAAGVEQRKIEYLIHSVEQLKGASFIRNGKRYSAALAIRYIRMRLASSGDTIHTADEFIVRYASRSSHTGRPYLIRFEDRHTEPTASYLRGLLAQWRAPPDTTDETAPH